jgi:DNA-binding XRE family transcriptional regulator
MNKSRLASYLRSHRKRSGLTQKELAALVGYPDEAQVSRHERLCCTPPLLIALGYEAVFRAPVSELFPGVYESLVASIEERLKALEQALHESTAKGRKAAAIARKLEWMWERQNLAQSNSSNGSQET